MHHSIEVERLNFSYPDGHQALNDVSLMIQPGEKVALVGPNGAGKSTLLLHLNGILSGTGTVRVCGLEVNKETVGRVRALVGMVFQSPDDLGLSPDVVKERVEQSLAAVAMSGYAQRVSHHLSMGEKKRIAIATVLSMEPEVLILDEPTGGLDPGARRSFINLLHELPLTMLVSSHDMSFVEELFPRMVILDKGRLVADGLTNQLMLDGDLLAAHGLERS
jgi:cobalt/nickel transport system ATP-binding protein